MNIVEKNKQSVETSFEIAHYWIKDIRAAIINIYKELEHCVHRVLRKNMI